MTTTILVQTVTDKLTPASYEALEKAMRLTKASGHRHLEIAHWLHYLVSDRKTDLCTTFKFFDLDLAKLQADLNSTLSSFKPGQTETPVMAESFVDLLREAWFEGTIRFNDYRIRSGYVLLAALQNPTMWRYFLQYSPEFDAISLDRLITLFDVAIQDSSEESSRPPAYDTSDSSSPNVSAADPSKGGTGETALQNYTIDFTQKARLAEFDWIIGRDEETRQIIDILSRRRQNNPILTGEAGVGKTAVVEGFAQQIVAGNVPPALRHTRLCALDLGLLQAGASMKGEFEKRLRGVIDEVQASTVPTILFIDEAHTLIGAGGAAGTSDAANLLKPALARGTLRTIAATTWSEYRQYFEKDPALTRRFQPVQVDEPDETKCKSMVQGLMGQMQAHHNVRILESAVGAAVTLSKRYIPARQLPDKAVSVLDTASARVNISQSARPARLSDAVEERRYLTAEAESLKADAKLGFNVSARLAELQEAVEAAETKAAVIEAEWLRQRATVAAIRRLNAALMEKDGGYENERLGPQLGRSLNNDHLVGPPTISDIDDMDVNLTVDLEDETAVRNALRLKREELEAIPSDERMVHAFVDHDAVASVISNWTGIPVGRMMNDELETVLNLTSILNKRVIGQSHGIEMIAKRIETSRAGLGNPNKPIGVFMLCGPSGVGKTETALALGEALYGGEDSLITINMSEFQEAHSVSGLKGAPPGYVGYGEGGRLTEAVRRKPYSVILLDEVEKAHPDVHEIFFQVFDKGVMEDGMGRRIDFRNSLILLTSNVGTDVIMDATRHNQEISSGDERVEFDVDATGPDLETLVEMLRPSLLDVFPPALLGRIVTVPYRPLSRAVLSEIISLQLDRVAKRVLENQKAELLYGGELVDHIASRCLDPDSGGRMIDNILTNDILPKLSRIFLKSAIAAEPISSVRLMIADGSISVDQSYC